MRILLATIFVFHCAGCLLAQQLLPLAVKDIGLMLRSGCSSEMILRDLSARHFAGTLDLAAEKELRQANASPALLDALKSDNNAASEEELAQARKKIADAKVAAQQEAAAQEAVAREYAAQEAAAQEAVAREYAAQQAAARKAAERENASLDFRVKLALYSRDPFVGLSPDQQRVNNRARQIAGNDVVRVNELMQDEAFVRDTLSR
jgi:hypothetical protein